MNMKAQPNSEMILDQHFSDDKGQIYSRGWMCDKNLNPCLSLTLNTPDSTQCSGGQCHNSLRIINVFMTCFLNIAQKCVSFYSPTTTLPTCLLKNACLLFFMPLNSCQCLFFSFCYSVSIFLSLFLLSLYLFFFFSIEWFKRHHMDVFKRHIKGSHKMKIDF